MRWMVAAVLACLVTTAHTHAQTQTPPSIVTTRPGWDIAVYPVYAWVPLFIGIDVDRPEGDGDSGTSIAGEILDSRFDGAFFGGVAATNGKWFLEGFGVWAAFGGHRDANPFMDVDVDVIYGDFRVGRRIVANTFVTGGVRRLALNYDIQLGDRPAMSEKPGLWDPLVGIAWHRPGKFVMWHAAVETGGFGVGADLEVATTFRFDWKISRHVGLTAGYGTWYAKVSRTIREKPLIMKASFHGPSFGLGLYF